MQYGQILEPEYKHEHKIIYDAFNKYFNNPMMSKLKNLGEYSMYLCKIQCLLANKNRYLIIFINKDTNIIGTQESLSHLTWISLQTREMEENYDVKPHTYIPRNMKPLDNIVTIENRDKEKSSYICKNLDLKITLLHKRGDVYEYNETGTIVTSIETYSTIITFI